MKGLVFTEFLEMVEDRFGFEVANRIIENSDLSSGGVYTSVGVYDHSELFKIVGELSKETGTEASKLVKTFGEYLFSRFIDLHPNMMAKFADTFSLIESVENIIHVEVEKIYPGAQLPTFKTDRISDEEMKVTYISNRKMSDFAEGLMIGCSNHFKENLNIEKKSNDDGSVVEFMLTRN
ncbi:MAG: heme NO-binding domain-containing protein [Candidatus Caenarcaniphilales bacterium]|nr:heme NO-binding domain-containing protein [Candidatus Caenarcaniphilales bacterium]